MEAILLFRIRTTFLDWCVGTPTTQRFRSGWPLQISIAFALPPVARSAQAEELNANGMELGKHTRNETSALTTGQMQS